MLGALAACAVAEPLIGHDAVFWSTLGKLLREAALYETETVRASPTSVTTIVGVGTADRPVRLFAVELKMAVAVAAATESVYRELL